MQSTSSPPLHPALLPLGTQVGPWRVVDWAGQGVHGAVYRAVCLGQEHLPAVALKLALLSDNPRFERERELLSRTLHPHIPRLVDHGLWHSPSGSRHPFIAMEWVDGVPLYDWARLFRPSAAQQLRLLAQVALTLQYLHTQGAFHRDLKGGNILVRRSDSRLFLTDFGSGIYPDADTLTPEQLPPGTPAYCSPEAWLFCLQFRHCSERYRAGPADDVFALGVTACVLATGSYPELGEPRQDEHATWHLEEPVLPRALFSAQVPPPLRELILRMLSLRPEQRGTPAQLTQALERAADSLSPRTSPPSASRLPWLAVALAAVAMAMWAGWMARAAYPAAGEGSSHAEPVGLSEAAASTATPGPARHSTSEPLAADSPPESFEGQVQPDKKGRCPHPQQVIFDDSCWARLGLNPEKCEASGGQMYQGACYVPIMRPGARRPNTSHSASPQ